MSLSAQEQIIRPDVTSLSASHQQRIIFATNIAETSVTIPNVTLVIDTGLEKTALFDVKGFMIQKIDQRILLLCGIYSLGFTCGVGVILH